MSPLANAEGAILPTSAPTPTPVGSTDELIGDGKAWGLSTSVDLQDCKPETIRDRDYIEAYVIALGLILVALYALWRIEFMASYNFRTGRTPVKVEND